MARILVAPDSFKGTFSALAVADAIGRGVERTGSTTTAGERSSRRPRPAGSRC
jgi:glycerate kinase